jgi:hypothetical protein
MALFSKYIAINTTLLQICTKNQNHVKICKHSAHFNSLRGIGECSIIFKN